MAGLLEQWGLMQPQAPGGGGLLGGFGNAFNDAMNNPAFMAGLGLAGGRTPQDGVQNMLNAIMMHRAFAQQKSEKEKAEARDKRDFDFRTQEAKRQAEQFGQSHALARENANRPQIVGSEQSGYHLVYPRSIPQPGQGAAGGGAGPTQPLIPGTAQTGSGQMPPPANPMATQLIPPTPRSFPAADKKAIFEAEDSAAQLKGTIDTLNRARELNRQTFTGYTAGARGKIGTSLPDGMVPDFLADPKGSAATREFGQLMSMEAIKSMSETLKGATTDKEMERFREIIADPTTPPDIREKTIDRMLGLAQRQQELNMRRTTDLRSGSYFRPEGQQGQPAKTPEQEAPRAAVTSNALLKAREAIANGADPAAVRKRLQDNGINPAGL